MSAKKRLDGIVARVRVSVHLDDAGRPLSASARIERPGDVDHERLVALAATHALDKEVLAAEQRAQRKDASVKAAHRSAEQRAKASAEHWTNEWFAKAHAEHPDYGRVLLARYARVLAAWDNIEKKERAKITASRAQQFLDRLRNATTSGRNATQSGC